MTEECVLVIEDEDIIREAIQGMLELDGLRCLVAADGNAGIALLREHKGQVRLVVMDRTMPGLSGPPAAEAIHAIDPDLPILLTSGLDEYSATKAFPPGAIVGYLQKPYPLPTLVQAVRRHLER
jgi:CheY-like chemotaxis protein